MTRCMSFVFTSMDRTSSSTFRFGSRLKMFCMLYTICTCRTDGWAQARTEEAI